jgi:hypothetical protein
MAKIKINDLREHLFATMEGLLDDENPMDLERAKTIASVGKVIIDTVAAETEVLKVMAMSGAVIEKAPEFFQQGQLTRHVPQIGASK